MKLTAFGLALDVVIVYTSCWLFFAKNPLGVDIIKHGSSAFSRLPLRPGANTSEIATSEQWYKYVTGVELGYYGTPQTSVFLRESAWINSIVVPRVLHTAAPHLVSTWIRNLIAAYILYFGVGSLWCAAIYWIGGRRWFPKASERPTWTDFTDQMQVCT